MIARAPPPSVHALGTAAAAAALLGAAVLVPIDAPPFSLFACPFRAATGLPCLSCGWSHAFHFFVRGHLADAAGASPFGAALALLCALHLSWTAMRLAGLPWAPRLPARRAAAWALGTALLASWIFVAVRA